MAITVHERGCEQYKNRTKEGLMPEGKTRPRITVQPAYDISCLQYFKIKISVQVRKADNISSRTKL